MSHLVNNNTMMSVLDGPSHLHKTLYPLPSQKHWKRIGSSKGRTHVSNVDNQCSSQCDTVGFQGSIQHLFPKMPESFNIMLFLFKKAFNGLPCGSVATPPANTGDAGLIPSWEDAPGEGIGNLFYYLVLISGESHGQRSTGLQSHGIARVIHDIVTKQLLQTFLAFVYYWNDEWYSGVWKAIIDEVCMDFGDLLKDKCGYYHWESNLKFLHGF